MRVLVRFRVRGHFVMSIIQFTNLVSGFLVRDASLLVTVGSRQCLDMTVGKIENGLERGFVKHRLNCPLITDPRSLLHSDDLYTILNSSYTVNSRSSKSATKTWQ